MERQQDVAYSCSSRTARKGLASTFGLAFYVILVAGTWLAYLRVVFFVPAEMAPSTIVLEGQPAPPISQPQTAEIGDGNERKWRIGPSQPIEEARE